LKLKVGAQIASINAIGLFMAAVKQPEQEGVLVCSFVFKIMLFHIKFIGEGRKMKKFLMLASLFLLILSTAGSVYAIPYTDFFDANRNMKMFDVVSWTFDITDGLDGFDPEHQDITSASIQLSLSDDGDSDRKWYFQEAAYLNIGSNHFIWEVDTGDITFEMSSLVTLNKYGIVNATLAALWGDFYFDSALLTAEGTVPDGGAGTTAPVPECATIFLLGAGLISLATVTRRKLKLNN